MSLFEKNDIDLFLISTKLATHHSPFLICSLALKFDKLFKTIISALNTSNATKTFIREDNNKKLSHIPL